MAQSDDGKPVERAEPGPQRTTPMDPSTRSSEYLAQQIDQIFAMLRFANERGIIIPPPLADKIAGLLSHPDVEPLKPAKSRWRW